MTQEDKNLLMQDLSARLRYGVKFPVETWDEDAELGNESKIIDTTLYSINTDGYPSCLMKKSYRKRPPRKSVKVFSRLYLICAWFSN